MNFQMFKLVLERAEEPEINLPTSAGSAKKQESSKKNIYFCFIDYAKALDGVDHNILWKILKEMGIPDHLTCLLRNLYVGQETTVRTGHGTTDWFQIGKGDQLANKHWIIEKAGEFHKKHRLLLPDLHTGFSEGRSGGLLFLSLKI